MQLNRRTFAASTIAMTAGLPAFRGLAQSTPEATPIASDLESRLLGVMNRFGVPGAVIAMTSSDNPEPMFVELGLANLETGEAVSADMHFRIASVTKTFVATVVLQLVDEDQLTLDSTISEILPELTVVNADLVTVRNLLSMRSGLPQLTENPQFISEIYLGDPANEVTVDQIFGHAVDMPARFEPGAQFEYNNLNYDILGEMIHTLTGITWHENVQTRISTPLGLANTLMTNTPELPTPHARGYGYLEQEIPDEQTGATPQATPIPDPAASPEVSPVNDSGAYDLTAFNPTVAGAAGGLISTVKDQVNWATALANGDLLSPEMHAEQINAIAVDESGAFGYGLGIINFGGMVAHNGAINGFQSAVASSPEFGVSIAVLTNCHPTIGMADAALELVVELLS